MNRMRLGGPMIYLCKSGRSYDIPQEVYDEILAMKTALATNPPAQAPTPAQNAAAEAATEGGSQ